MNEYDLVSYNTMSIHQFNGLLQDNLGTG